MEDGVYKSKLAVYFVKDNKVIMRMDGGFYKTTENFMIGATREHDLTPGMDSIFGKTYSQLKSW